MESRCGWPQTLQAFTDVSGRLRFDDSMVIFEGPTGFFGQLPITVVGTVDISKDYNLIGFVRRVAIKDILQTFRMDPSLPLHGSVKAEVRMHGPLESPLLTGTATSVGPPWRADRIPIQNARADFQLDASSMQLEIMNMEATLQDGGQLSGQGSLRLASTKERTTSSEPKPPISGGAAASESGAVSPSLGAPPSIDFSLNLRRAYAGPLLAHYLPKTTPPETCVDPIGRITANLILSGPLTETKLELRWRLIGTNPLGARSAAETVSLETVKPNAKLYGAACGTLQMSLADMAETQRLRFTLDAYGVDLRRFLWRPAWSSAPKVLLDTRLFADVTLQTLTKTEAAPRHASARAQTNGAQRPLQLQATLDLRRFQLNAFGYTRRLSGELRYHPVDGLRFDAVPYDQRTERSTDERSEPDHRSRSKIKPSYLASFSSDPSFKRELEVHLRHGPFRLEASLHQGTRFEAHMENMPIERLLGHDYGAGGIVQARASIDLEQERGTSSFALRDAYFRHFRCREFTGEMYWLDKTVFLQNSVLQQERSEYHIEGVYSDNKPRLDDSPQTLPNWQTKIVIPRGDIAELACLTQAFDGQLDPTILSFWEIPPHLSLEDQILWFAEYWSASADEDPQMAIGRAHQRHSASSAAGERDTSASSSTSRAVSVPTRNARMGSKNTEQPPSLADLRGTYRGTITLSSGVERLSFDLSGEKWALGPHELGTMRARGGMRQGIINLEQLSFQAPTTGTMVHLNGTAEPAGSVKASVQVAKIPLHLMSEYGWTPFRIAGALNASVELAGTVQEPMLRLKALWQDASVNGLRMRDTLAELVCEAGRCRVSATAAVPVQQRNWGPVRPRWRFWKRSTANTAQQRWLDHEEDPETAKQARSGTSGTRASASTALGSSMPLSGIRLNGSVPFRLSSILERFMDMNRPWNERLEGWSFAQVFRGGHPSDSMHLDVQVKRSGVALATAFFPQLPVSGGSADLRIRLRGTPLHPQVTARCSLSDVRISPPDLETPY
ncbi:hypothetical protein F1559_002060 [Cyanidiococcus yangmingshanensis]|uniref:Uncharacterized protein n=1 Tax=Cyanidiococcus yangmingshanensis TaxID=2690220 RepID=A0A7J7INH9_9RHOD|nr:hypothetical protein F1559_002060 [Cyanidiococcus yangmingshanensis]